MGFVSVLTAMLIAAALYLGYFRMHGTVAEQKVGIAAVDASRGVACRTNRQTVERALLMWSVNHAGEAPSLAALEREGSIPSCPDGGRYELVAGEVHCSRHR